MSSEDKRALPPSYDNVTNPSSLPSFSHGNQYNQYQPPAGATGQYLGYQYPPQDSSPGPYPDQQVMGVPQGLTHNAAVTQPVTAFMMITPLAREGYMIPAILSCVCFFPLGIFAILAARKAKTAAANGDVVEAQAQSRRVRMLVGVSVVIGLFIIGFSILQIVISNRH
ncbi:uncharacterized protein LOC134242101 [Saccostrea cucullata]|uniref:uncharacterized protein LOC134242101 n=1 Tax=Saccostrea cuccullata TaxID=36930 RepID=UPI002ED56D67